MPAPKDPIKYQEWIRKKSASMRGNKNPRHGAIVTQETKEKISAALTGDKHPNFGKHFSEDHRKKIGLSRVGVPRSEETKQRMRKPKSVVYYGKENSHFGKPLSEDHKKVLSEKLSGKNNPQFGKCGEHSTGWKGGISFEPYCPKFNTAFKERVRSFFNYRCVECGAPQNGSKLHIHHVNFNKKTCCDDSPPLFVALCHSCHSKTNFNRPFWEFWFTEMILKTYNGKCYDTGEAS